MKFKATPPKAIGNLVKLKAGEEIDGVFRGEPVEFFAHWPGKRSVRCSGDGCPHCNAGDAPRFRFQVNFATLENGALVAKVFEGSGQTYDMLKALNKGSPLEWLKVKLMRQGSGQNDTRYFVMSLPDQNWNPEAKRQLEALKLNDLGESEVTEDKPDLEAAGSSGLPADAPTDNGQAKSKNIFF